MSNQMHDDDLPAGADLDHSMELDSLDMGDDSWLDNVDADVEQQAAEQLFGDDIESQGNNVDGDHSDDLLTEDDHSFGGDAEYELPGDDETEVHSDDATSDDTALPSDDAAPAGEEAPAKKSKTGLFIAAGAVALLAFGGITYNTYSKLTHKPAAMATKAKSVDIDSAVGADAIPEAQLPSSPQPAQPVAAAPTVNAAPPAHFEAPQQPVPATQEPPPAPIVAQNIAPAVPAVPAPTAAIPTPAPVAQSAPQTAPVSSAAEQIIAAQQQAIEELSQRSAELTGKVAALETHLAELDARQTSMAKASVSTVQRARMKGFQVAGASSDGQMLIVKLGDGTNRALAVGDNITYQGKKMAVTALDAAAKTLTFGEKYFIDETLEPVTQKTAQVAAKPAPRPEPKDRDQGDAIPASATVSYQAGASSTKRQEAAGWTLNARFDADKFLIQDPKGNVTSVRIGQTVPGMGEVQGLDKNGNLMIGLNLIKQPL